MSRHVSTKAWGIWMSPQKDLSLTFATFIIDQCLLGCWVSRVSCSFQPIKLPGLVRLSSPLVTSVAPISWVLTLACTRKLKHRVTRWFEDQRSLSSSAVAKMNWITMNFSWTYVGLCHIIARFLIDWKETNQIMWAGWIVNQPCLTILGVLNSALKPFSHHQYDFPRATKYDENRIPQILCSGDLEISWWCINRSILEPDVHHISWPMKISTGYVKIAPVRC